MAGLVPAIFILSLELLLMRRYLIVFLTLLLPINVTAQQNKSAVISPLASQSLLLDITSVKDNFVVAVGERGHIIQSENLKEWHQQEVPVQSTLTGVTFTDKDNGWAVGHDSVILHTANGGQSWQIQQYLPKQQKPLLDVAFKNSNEGIAIGSYGLFYRTTDGGKTWQREFHTSLLPEEDIEYLEELRAEDEQAYLEERASILPHFNQIYIDGVTTYLVGELGLIAKSNDFGKTWQRAPEIYQGSFYDFSRTKLGNLLAVGLRGNIFRSIDSGASWQNIQINQTALLNKVIYSPSGLIYILGNNGVLLESNNDGVMFNERVQTDGKALLSATIFNNKLVVASEIGIKVFQVKN